MRRSTLGRTTLTPAASLAGSPDSDDIDAAVERDPSGVTFPAARPDPAAWQPLRAAISQLVHEAESLALLSSEPVGNITPAQHALHRLITNTASAGDELVRGISVKDARVLGVIASSCAAADRVAVQLRNDRDHLMTWVSPNRLVILVRNSPHRLGDERSLNNARALARQIARVDPGAHLGISETIPTGEVISGAVADAFDAAQLADLADNPVEVGRVWAEITAERLRQHLRACRTQNSPLLRLFDYDAGHRTRFAYTIARWLHNNQDTQATARELHIHPNTLRYRVKRGQDLVGLNLQDPTHRLVVELSLS
jgi:hypothetical protein